MALVVVFLALLGFAGYSVVAHTGMTASEKMTRAVTLAQEKLEDVRRDGVPISLTGTWINTEPYGSIAGASASSTHAHHSTAYSNIRVTHCHRRSAVGP